MPEREPRPESPLSNARGLIVALLLGGGSVVMLKELWERSVNPVGAVLLVGVVILSLLPRPIDVRSAVYAFFVPTAMTYGAFMDQFVMLILGIAAGGFFLLEKTVLQKRSESKDSS